jgi:hypothetical protein
MFYTHRSSVQPESFIIRQPQAVDNAFALAPQEQIQRTYIKKPGGCGCGPTFTVHITNARIIQRRQDYSCCGTGEKTDSMLFLSDISTMSNTVMKRSGCPSLDCGSILCCILLCFCEPCCRGQGGKEIGIRGAFGEEVFTFAKGDVSSALKEIPVAAMPHKTATHRY